MSSKYAAPKEQVRLESQVMQLAQAVKGKLSASDVAAGTHLGTTESHRLLKALVKKGVAEVWVTDDGGSSTCSPNFLQASKRVRATRLPKTMLETL